MAVTTTVAGKFKQKLLSGQADFTSATVKVTLHTSSFAPDVDTTEFKSDLTNELATAGGYTAGGQTLTTVAVSYDAANDRAIITCDDPTWDPATFTARYAVIWIDTGTAATSPVVFWVNFGADQSPSGVPFVLDVSADLLRAA